MNRNKTLINAESHKTGDMSDCAKPKKEKSFIYNVAEHMDTHCLTFLRVLTVTDRFI